MLSEQPWDSVQVFSSQSLKLALCRNEWMLLWLRHGGVLHLQILTLLIISEYFLPPIIFP